MTANQRLHFTSLRAENEAWTFEGQKRMRVRIFMMACIALSLASCRKAQLPLPSVPTVQQVQAGWEMVDADSNFKTWGISKVYHLGGNWFAQLASDRFLSLYSFSNDGITRYVYSRKREDGSDEFMMLFEQSSADNAAIRVAPEK